ncbi:3-keto-disaccharide hydrolase [Alienimonas californiensis]|uniref:3-keto-alpha-glucoside-1,2-lyase/3-keto-2-hydroxy-glucal hydratase domain-containing protein n=1 Tax=Alienimonas californiensis TaxID=2527989 RepID=A0A517PCY6_9PLAN|nr:DUF1080 domain-containing protein [Alienimonas californiensis]QDT17244.1 hypothetical protein CA12_33580 [Alienimonas californiensis]
MTISLRGTTLACGFAGALLFTLAGCGVEREETVSIVAEPSEEPDDAPIFEPVEAPEAAGSEIDRVLAAEQTPLPADADGIVQPVPEAAIAEGAVAVLKDGDVIEFRPEPTPLDLASFTPVDGSKAETTLEDGVLRIKGGLGFMRSEKQYGDFILQAEVKLNSPDSNSGIFFRTMEPTAEAPSNGYEMQLQNTLGPGGRTDPDDYGDGFGTGGIFRQQAARYVNANDGEWFHVTLVVVGNRMATWVNGLQVTDFTDERDPDPNPRKGRRDDAGYLVLQGHDPTTDVSFRNLRIQEL